MLTTIKSWMSNRRDREAMLNLRATMVSIHQHLFCENEITGQLVRLKTGLALEQRLENRLGVRGPDFFEPVTTDYELEHEAKLLDKLPPERLAQLSSELGRLAGRTLLERGTPEEWDDDSGEPTANIAHLIALRLLSGWLTSKSIVHSSMNRTVVKEAQALDDLHFGIFEACYASFAVRRRYR